MKMNRRSLIVGAGFATAAPALVRAESLLEVPGDPLTKRGLFAATKWAAEEFTELPGCRLVFADGQTTRWMTYTCMSRPDQTDASKRTHAVAIEAVTTDASGRRFVTSVPVDGVKLANDQATQRQRQLALIEDHARKWQSRRWQHLYSDDEIPF